MYPGDLRIYAGTAGQQLAEEMADFLDIPLGRMEIEQYADGEIDVDIKDSIRGKDIFIVQPTCTPVNDNLMELLIIIDAMRRNDARRVCVVIPYYGYARKERKTKPRDPISARLVANLLTAAGVDQVIFVELHATAAEGFFDIPTTHLETTQLLANAFILYKKKKGKIANYLTDLKYKKLSDEERLHVGKDVVVVAPDVGGARRARNFARYFGQAHFAIIEKRRSGADKSEILNIIGEVKGLEAIIVDDMISTGGTMVPLVKILREKGAKKVYGCVTHPVFAGKAIENLKKANFDALFVTNTIPLPAEKTWDSLYIVSVGQFLASVSHRIHQNRSVSELF